jgi:hypothetical protein
MIKGTSHLIGFWPKTHGTEVEVDLGAFPVTLVVLVIPVALLPLIAVVGVA